MYLWCFDISTRRHCFKEYLPRLLQLTKVQRYWNGRSMVIKGSGEEAKYIDILLHDINGWCKRNVTCILCSTNQSVILSKIIYTAWSHYTIYPIKYVHGLAVFCFAVVISWPPSKSIWYIYLYFSRLFHWHGSNCKSAMAPVMYFWSVWVKSIIPNPKQNKMWTALKWKPHHFDEIFITDSNGSCQNDNFLCSQWWNFHQNDNFQLQCMCINLGMYCPYHTLILWHESTTMRSTYSDCFSWQVFGGTAMGGLWPSKTGWVQMKPKEVLLGNRYWFSVT